jgi:hypothetical protein
MTFRDREKARQIPLKKRLFSAPACRVGKYRGKTAYPFCLDAGFSSENLHETIRSGALQYFSERDIVWNDGFTTTKSNDRPSNHLTCSQSLCVNTWFPYVSDPKRLRDVLFAMGYPAEEVLPVTGDRPLADGSYPFVAFEWIGKKNYLAELAHGKVAADDQRSRGQGFTSADFVIQFRRIDGRIHIVLGEWKYTESYSGGRKRLSDSKAQTDRLGKIYDRLLSAADSPLHLLPPTQLGSLFFDPFDQMMRLQLLAHEMEKAREMDADIVTVLHVAPRGNRELMDRITSRDLRRYGTTIHTVWSNITECGKFKGYTVEDLLSIAMRHAPSRPWAEWMGLRYGEMK